MPRRAVIQTLTNIDLGSVSVARATNVLGQREDYIALPLRVLEALGLSVWEDETTKPHTLRVRAGAPKSIDDLMASPDEVVDDDEMENSENYEWVKGRKCPSCGKEEIYYHELRNRYDCDGCNASFDFGNLLFQDYANVWRDDKDLPMWHFNGDHSVTKVKSNGRQFVAATDLRGNFIAIEVPDE